MKIYFEDGPLHEYDGTLPFDRKYYIISTNEGVQQNLGLLDYLKHFCSIDVTVYTNSILAFDNKYAWNDELKVPEVYIRTGFTTFERIDHLTDKEIRYAHNIGHMYLTGAFNTKVSLNNNPSIYTVEYFNCETYEIRGYFTDPKSAQNCCEYLNRTEPGEYEEYEWYVAEYKLDTVNYGKLIETLNETERLEFETRMEREKQKELEELARLKAKYEE